MIPVHITDFIMPRSNLAVFCGRHIPKSDCFIWKFDKRRKAAFRILDVKKIAYERHRKVNEPLEKKLGIEYRPLALNEIATPNAFSTELMAELPNVSLRNKGLP